jgi:hypothetical protein
VIVDVEKQMALAEVLSRKTFGGGCMQPAQAFWIRVTTTRHNLMFGAMLSHR